MDVNKIKQLFNNVFVVYVISVIFFVICLNTVNLTAQVVSQDSLKTDTAITKIVELNQLDEDSTITVELSDTIKSVDDDLSLIHKRKKIIPARAALYSMILPGLGQAYNGKYWKIPIVYTIFGTMYYFAADNNQKFKDFKFAYVNYDDVENRPVWVNDQIDKKYLKERMEFYKRNRDFNIIIGGLFYLLNILDANVDAHLMDFDVSDDLSLRVKPDLYYFQASQKKSNVSGFGIKFVLSLNR